MPHAPGQQFVLPHVALDTVTLRPLRAADAPAWYGYLRDPRVVQDTSFDIHGLADVEALVRTLLAGTVHGTDARFAIARTSDDLLIGTIGLHDPQQGAMELGYDLARAYWGRGIATQATRRVLAWGFEELDLQRIQATVVEGHSASVRVLEKCGFHKEGVLQDYRLCRGALRDFGMYAVLRRNRAATELTR